MQKKSGMIAIDTHTHSSGVSRCSRVTPKELIDQKIEQGYDGIVLTNHCQPWYYPAEEHKQYVESVIAEYRAAKAYGDKVGFRVLLGVEVTILNPAAYDMLIYGVTEEMLRASSCLYQMTQKELFDFCNKYGALLVHAHPLRLSFEGKKEGIANPAYIHGTEINCTPKDLVLKDELLQVAKENELLVTCGTDYHAPDRTFRGGMYVPDTVYTSTDFAEYLKSTKTTQLFLEDECLEIAVPAVIERK